MTTTTYTDPQERTEAALLIFAKLSQEFERHAAHRVASEYRMVNNYVTDGAVLDLMQSVIYDMREELATR